MEIAKDSKADFQLPVPVRIAEQVWDDSTIPFLSICCITYNQAGYIKKSIDSFLMQETTFPVEIIIRDDASTDGTQEIVRDYAKQYPRLIKTILHSENQFKKSKRAFPETYSAANGDLIALCEGDDYWTTPTKLQKQVFLLRQNPDASFCFHNTPILNEKMEVSGQLRPQNPSLIHSIEELLGSNFIHTSSIVFRKSMLGKFPEWYDSAPMGDWPLCILLAEKGNFLYINEVMSHYRLHAQSSWSSQNQATRCAKTAHLFDLLRDHFAKKPELLAKVNNGFIMHCLNAARDFKSLNDTENANFFHEKVIEALAGVRISERVQERYAKKTPRNSENASLINSDPEFKSKTIQNDPLVSICIPTFNGEPFIKNTLLSAISQNFPNIEIIVSDDSSTDRTCEIAEDILRDCKFPFRVLKHARMGLVENWNFCIEEAKGKYIKFLFQDDHLEPSCVKKLVEVAERESNIGMVFSRRGVESVGGTMIPADSIDLHKGWSRLQRIQKGRDLLHDPKLLANPINKVGEPTTVLLNREILNSLGGFDPNLRQLVDVDMWLRIMMVSNIGFVDEQLSTFRLHQGQATRDNVKAGIIQRDWETFYRKLAESSDFKNLPTFNKQLATQMLEKISEKSSFQPSDLGVIGAWRANPTNPELLEKVKSLRLQLANSMFQADKGQFDGLLQDKSADSYSALLLSGIQSEFISAEDKDFLQSIISTKDAGKKNAFFATALFKPAHLIPAFDDLSKLPKEFRGTFFEYLFKSLEVFLHLGEAESYCEHLLFWLREAVRRIEKEPGAELTRELASAAMQLTNQIPAYCSPESNRELTGLRAKVIEFFLIKLGGDLAKPAKSRPAKHGNRKIRVGILNAHFGLQTETFVTMPAMHLDKSRFELHLFHCVKNPSAIEERCRALADGMHLLPEAIGERVKMIRNTNLDAIIIGTNISAVTNQIALLAAFRLAPMQIVSHCSPMTVGFKSCDAFLSGYLAYSPGLSEEEFHEKLILLDGPPVCLDYSCEPQAAVGGVPDRAHLGIPAGAPVFFNAASCFKMPLELLQTWVRLLKEVPEAYLCLLPFNPNWTNKLPEVSFRRVLEGVLKEAGVEPNRVVIGRSLPNRAAVMEFERIADVYLDTFPFAGSISTVDPLQLGIPVVACNGKTTRSRCSGAQLREIGMEELVAKSEEEYLQKAVRLARDVQYRKDVSSRIQEAMCRKPRFLDPTAYGRSLGNALEILVDDGIEALSDPVSFHDRLKEKSTEESDASQAIFEPTSATLEVAVSAFNAGRLTEAEDVCRELLQADEKCAGAWSLMARMAALNGDLETAGDFASVACELEPSNPACLATHAEVLLDRGELEDAEEKVRAALLVQPGSPHNLALLGRILSAKGGNASALEAFEQALRTDRNNPGILIHHGLALQKADRGKDAIAQLRKACTADPSSVEPLVHLGMLLEENARYADALATYNKAADAHPDVAFLRFRRGKLLNGLQRYEEAREELACAVGLPGAPLAATYELGLAHQMLRDSLKALELYDEALRRGLETADLHCNRGVLLKETNRQREAVASFHRAVTLEPENVHFMNNLGAAALELGFNSEALECFRSAVERNPKLPTAHNNLGNLLKDRGKAWESLEHYRRSMELSPDNLQTVSNYLLAHQYPPGMDPATVHEEHRSYGIQIAKSIRPSFQPNRLPRPESGEKIHLGFLSADFCQHPVASFTEGLFRHLDRNAFRITVYADYTKPDAMSEHLKTLVDDWHETSTLNSADLAKRIHSDSIHILFDLAGHTALNRLDLFCMKPAPAQVTWLGYPSTTGIPAIGYRLTDAIADPPGQTEKLHTEHLVRIPGCAWGYTAHPKAGDVAPLPASSNGFVTFGCFNNMAKWNDPLYELWAEILRRTPSSRLRLKAKALVDQGVRDELLSWFDARGIPADRLLLAGHSPRLAGHFAEYNQVDIALDTHPYHGTTTTCEALWMGVPVVSLAGDTHVSRVGASLLHAVGLPHLSTTNPEDHIATATALASDLTALADLRSSLRERMATSLLMDTPRHATHFATALREILARATR